ncbi:hypothetical protein [Halococcus sp. AFM35]|uniref:hypothetical protein n=1 Tax=Halococcus sp. AFM35 TaxID=3421653 RepID=UPI003EBE9719
MADAAMIEKREFEIEIREWFDSQHSESSDERKQRLVRLYQNVGEGCEHEQCDTSMAETVHSG